MANKERTAANEAELLAGRIPGKTHVELTPQAARLLHLLATQNNMTAAAIVERGIALMATALKAEQQGFSLAVVDGYGDIIADITGVTPSAPARGDKQSDNIPTPGTNPTGSNSVLVQEVVSTNMLAQELEIGKKNLSKL